MHEIPEIKKGFLVESSEPGEEGTWRLKTDGVNLQASDTEYLRAWEQYDD